jgi:hypothetical protein
MLTREQILQANDLPTQEVPVPEWGGSVLVRGLTGKERDEFEMSMIQMTGPSVELRMQNARARLVALGCIDEQGNRLFTAKDVEALSRKSGAALDRVYSAIQKLSGLSADDMKELTANFTVALAGGSTSG